MSNEISRKSVSATTTAFQLQRWNKVSVVEPVEVPPTISADHPEILMRSLHISLVMVRKALALKLCVLVFANISRMRVDESISRHL
ncbi:hypothetical protein DMENIID0001_008900 [Sergentomyia squamirostris]